MQLAELLEAMMIVSFGISWPLSIIRSYRSRQQKERASCSALYPVWLHLRHFIQAHDAQP